MKKAGNDTKHWIVLHPIPKRGNFYRFRIAKFDVARPVIGKKKYSWYSNNLWDLGYVRLYEYPIIAFIRWSFEPTSCSIFAGEKKSQNFGLAIAFTPSLSKFWNSRNSFDFKISWTNQRQKLSLHTIVFNLSDFVFLKYFSFVNSHYFQTWRGHSWPS